MLGLQKNAILGEIYNENFKVRDWFVIQCRKNVAFFLKKEQKSHQLPGKSIFIIKEAILKDKET